MGEIQRTDEVGTLIDAISDVCESHGYKIGREVIINPIHHIFVINDPELTLEEKQTLAFELSDAIESHGGIVES